MERANKTRSTICTIAATLAMVFTGSLRGDPTIVNGDFESGDVGFTTGYGWVYGISRNPGDDTIDTNPASYHPGAASYWDHTSGTGNMLIVDGILSPDVTVWEQSIAVTPNTAYTFSYFLSWWTYETDVWRPQVECLVNGISVGIAGTPPGAGVWIPVSHSWQSGGTTLATVRLVDLNHTDFGGNDFAIDDISMTVVPVPGALVLGAVGLSCAGWRLRRWAS
jgi:hypothetical protein